MDFWSALPVPALLLACAVNMLAMHVRAWRKSQDSAEPREVDFYRRQYRRRMQTSAMLAVLAVALFLGQLLTPLMSPLVFGVYWLVTILLALWMAFLAIADMLATRHHYASLRADYAAEQARLNVELRRAKAVRDNGQDAPGDPYPSERHAD